MFLTNEDMRIVIKKNQKLQTKAQNTGHISNVNTAVVITVIKINTTIEFPIINPGKFTP